MNSDSDFNTKLTAAREWEVRVATWARQRGWYVLPAYDFSGSGDAKAPKLLAPGGSRSLVLPDLLLMRLNTVHWLEVKWKKRADFNRNRQIRVTGINLRLWNHYCEVQEKVGGEVFVMFLHESEREVRGDSLTRLRASISHTYTGSKMGHSGMVFWDYDKMRLWGDLKMIERWAA